MSPRSKQQNEQIKEDRRAQILEAALRVFARRGLAATKIGDIAAEAGLSHGLVYHYFPSKEDIFTELVREADQTSASAVLQMEQLDLPPLEKLRAITSMLMQEFSGHVQSAYYFTVMAQAMLSGSGPLAAQQTPGSFTVPSAVLMRVIAQGQAQGTVRGGDPMALSTLFWSAIQGLAAYRLMMGDGMPLPDASLLMRLFEPGGD